MRTVIITKLLKAHSLDSTPKNSTDLLLFASLAVTMLEKHSLICFHQKKFQLEDSFKSQKLKVKDAISDLLHQLGEPESFQ